MLRFTPRALPSAAPVAPGDDQQPPAAPLDEAGARADEPTTAVTDAIARATLRRSLRERSWRWRRLRD